MSEKENSAFIERFTIRMPDGMRDSIAERAKRNGRSMNSEIISILENALYCGEGDLDDMNANEMLTVIKDQKGLLEQYELALKSGTEALKSMKEFLSNKKPPNPSL